MKKLLVIGAMSDVLEPCKVAKELGIYVINFRNDFYAEPNPYADEIRELDLFDKEAVLAAAKEVKPDGLLANACVYAPVAAYVGTQLGLRVNSPESVGILRSKYQFRDVASKCGIFQPKHVLVESKEELASKIEDLKYPIIFKPLSGNGSYGVQRFDEYDGNEMARAFDRCMFFPGSVAIIVEEFVQAISPETTLAAEGFVHKGKFVWGGVLKALHNPQSPLFPMTASCPLNMGEGDVSRRLYESAEKVLKAAGITYGEFLVEAILTDKNEVFIIEINPRQGGMKIPWASFKHTGIDFTRLLVTTAVGDDSYFEEISDFKPVSRPILFHLVFADTTGVYKGIREKRGFPGKRIKIVERNKIGDEVHPPIILTDSVATVYYEFDNAEDMLSVRDEMNDWVKPVIQKRRWYHKYFIG